MVGKIPHKEQSAETLWSLTSNGTRALAVCHTHGCEHLSIMLGTIILFDEDAGLFKVTQVASGRPVGFEIRCI